MRTLRLLVVTASLSGIALQMGCCMCANPYDDHYTAYGGIKQRADRTCGRVGSVFRNAEAAASTEGQPYYDDDPYVESDGQVYEQVPAEVYDDGRIYDEPYDAGLDDLGPGLYDDSRFGPSDDRSSGQLPTPADQRDDPLSIPDDLGAPDSGNDFGLPQLPSLDEMNDLELPSLP